MSTATRVTVTETVNNRDLSGWFMLSNGHKIGWIAGNGDGELSAFVEKPDGGFLNKMSGWYRTSDPMNLLQKVITIAGWELVEAEERADTPADAGDIIALMNRQVQSLREQLGDTDAVADLRRRAKISELQYILGRITAHKMGIRDISKAGD